MHQRFYSIVRYGFRRTLILLCVLSLLLGNTPLPFMSLGAAMASADTHQPSEITTHVAAGNNAEFTIIAKTGDAGITSFGASGGAEYSSINDSGLVGFIAQVGAGQGIFVGDGVSSPVRISFPDSAPAANRRFGPGLQIDNGNRVYAVDQFVGVSLRTNLSQWNADAPGQVVTWAQGNANPAPFEMPD